MKKKIVLNISPMKTTEEAKLMAKVIDKFLKENEDKEVLLNFKQIDGSNNVYKEFMPSEEGDNEDTKV